MAYALRLFFRSWWAAVALILANTALADDRSATTPRIVTTTAMIGEPLTVIADDKAQVEFLLGEGVDPHLYRPTRSDIVRLTRADIILYNGLSLEAQLMRPIEQLRSRAKVLAIAEAVDDGLWLPYDNGPGDPHLWMDPQLWRQALSAAVAFVQDSDPDNRDAYRAGADAYFQVLDQLNIYAADVMATIPKEARVLITAHDAFNYFGARFGIEVRGIQGISTESEAGLREIEALVDLLVERKVPAVFVETSVSERQVRALIDGAAARGHEVTVGGTLYSDAMGRTGTYEGTYIGMMDHNVTTIARALGGQAPVGGAFGRLTAGSGPGEGEPQSGATRNDPPGDPEP